MRFHRRRLAALAAAGVSALVSAPAGAQQINTGPYDGQGIVMGGGGNGSPGYTDGQSFTVPVGFNAINQFQFDIGDYNGSFPRMTYRAYLTAWDGEAHRTIGPVLWQSALLAGTSNYVGTSLTAFLTGGVPVTPGASYIAFLSAWEWTASHPTDPSAGYVYGVVGETAGNPYPGGSAYFTYETGTFASITGNAWQPLSSARPDDDFEFTATFSTTATTVPEPTGVALTGAGLLGVIGVAARRRAQQLYRG